MSYLDSDLSSVVIISHGALVIGFMSIEKLALVAILGVLSHLSMFTQGFIRHSTYPSQFFYFAMCGIRYWSACFLLSI